MLGEKLKNYRINRGLSQCDVAEMSGINEKYYGRIERDESCPTIEMLNKICNALKIDMVEFFLFEYKDKSNLLNNEKICKIIRESITKSFDVHFNRDVIINNCENTIWYSGYIGSISFDEFEMKIYAEGNIKAKLYLDGNLVLELNNSNISNELLRYVKDDKELNELISYSEFDKEILNNKNGNVLFIDESNWLTAEIVNNSTNEIVESGIILDTDNILDSFLNQQLLFDYIFKQ